MRVATSFMHNTAAADIMRAQRAIFDAQRQAGSEKKADDLKGFDKDAKAMVSARGYVARAEAYVRAGAEIANRLSTQDIALGRLAGSAQEVRLALTEALALDRGDQIMARVAEAFQAARGAVNTTYAGRYLFGGVRDDAPPLTADSLDDLAAAAAAGDVFENAPRKATAQVDPRTVIDLAPLADDVAEPLFDVFKALRDYEIANGPFSAPLTPAQDAFVRGVIAQIEPIVGELNAEQSLNGGKQERLNATVDRQSQEVDYFSGLVADIENVDLAEVASRLAQAQTQLQASAQIYATLRDTTLLNYLR